MRSGLSGGLIFILAAVAVVLYSSTFVVDETEQVLVLQFGEPKRVIREPGLYFKTPFVQNLRYFDKRLLDLDLEPKEIIVADEKRMIVDAFAKYWIVDPLIYYRSFGSDRAARGQVADIIDSVVRDVFGNETLVSVVRDKRAELMRKITVEVSRKTAQFGIQMLDIKSRRVDLPKVNAEIVYQRMRTSFEEEASQYRGESAQVSETIRSAADQKVEIILARAQERAQKTRGEGDADSVRIWAEAFAEDPEFFDFYRSLQAYETSLGGDNTTIVMSPDSEFFNYFKAPN